MKRNTQKKIEAILNKLSSKYEGAKFRYEYRAYCDTHVVEVTPLSLYENSKYSDEEFDIVLDFEKNYGETLLFVSEHSLTKVTNPLYEVAHKKEEVTSSIFNQLFDFSYRSDYVTREINFQQINNYEYS